MFFAKVPWLYLICGSRRQALRIFAALTMVDNLPLAESVGRLATEKLIFQNSFSIPFGLKYHEIVQDIISYRGVYSFMTYEDRMK